MGSKLLIDDTANGGSAETESPFLISEMFETCFPYYLSLGMTYDEYWNGDPTLVRAYRKAEDIKRHKLNMEMWLQGRYVYDAVMRLLPSMNAFKPKEPLPYLEEPYALTEEEAKERELREEKKRQQLIFDKMMAQMNAQKLRKKEVQDDG